MFDDSGFSVGDPSPEDVRWYYSSGPFESKKLLELPSKGSFTRFCHGDSVTLELEYRRHAEAVDTTWWQAHGEALKHPDKAPGEEQLRQATVQPLGPVVRAGYFEANVSERKMYPIYWKGPTYQLLRGVWFVEASSGVWLPLPHALAAKLESAWQSRVFDPLVWQDHKPQPEGVTAARVDVNDILLQDYYALFCSRREMYLCTYDHLAFIKNPAKLFSKDKGPPGARLRRGYRAPEGENVKSESERERERENEDAEERLAGMAVRHLVLCVHGIGQRLGGTTIVDDAREARKRINQMLDSHLPVSEIGGGYIEVLPVQWRKNLDLEADEVAHSIMPEGARGFRQMAHNTCVEVLMYMSPAHCQYIVDSVSSNLNNTHLRFKLRHPRFNGRVSILAYSLGSVLCYDILVHQPIPPGYPASQALAAGMLHAGGPDLGHIDPPSTSQGAAGVGVSAGAGGARGSNRVKAVVESPRQAKSSASDGSAESVTEAQRIADQDVLGDLDELAAIAATVRDSAASGDPAAEAAHPADRHKDHWTLPFLRFSWGGPKLDAKAAVESNGMAALGPSAAAHRVEDSASMTQHDAPAAGDAESAGAQQNSQDAASRCADADVQPLGPVGVELSNSHVRAADASIGSAAEGHGAAQALAGVLVRPRDHEIESSSSSDKVANGAGDGGGPDAGSAAGDCAIDATADSDTQVASRGAPASTGEAEAAAPSSAGPCEAPAPDVGDATTPQPQIARPLESRAMDACDAPGPDVPPPSESFSPASGVEAASPQPGASSSGAGPPERASGPGALVEERAAGGRPEDAPAVRSAAERHDDDTLPADVEALQAEVKRLRLLLSRASRADVAGERSAAADSSLLMPSHGGVQQGRIDAGNLTPRADSGESSSSPSRLNAPQQAGPDLVDAPLPAEPDGIGVTSGTSRRHDRVAFGSTIEWSDSEPRATDASLADLGPLSGQEGAEAGAEPDAAAGCSAVRDGVLADPPISDIDARVDGEQNPRRQLWTAERSRQRANQVPITSPHVRYSKLDFEVDKFIMIGSPTGLFCALRGINPRRSVPLGSLAAEELYVNSAPGALPVCRRMFNVFHPYDPVGYRMEPLVHAANKKAVRVPYHRGGKKLHISMMDAGENFFNNTAWTFDRMSSSIAGRTRSQAGATEQGDEPAPLVHQSLIWSILGAPPPPEQNLTAAFLPVHHEEQSTDGAGPSPSRETQRLKLTASCESLAELIPGLAEDQHDDEGSIFGLSPKQASVLVKSPSKGAVAPAPPPNRQGRHLSAPQMGAAAASDSKRVGWLPRGTPREHASLAPHEGPPSSGGENSTSGLAPVRSESNLAAARSDADGRNVPAALKRDKPDHNSSAGRLDFVLQEDFAQTQYISAFTAHFGYWKHEDVALFVCRAVCGYDVVDGSRIPTERSTADSYSCEAPEL